MHMALITIKLTIRELEQLTTLASDELFRREFIDRRLPGYEPNSTEMSVGKALIARLRAMVQPECMKRTQTAGMVSR
jgi:DNA-binding response OmpR family regulator